MIPAYYSILWMQMTKTANRCGYALALHGSMGRDLDLVAIPWIDECDSKEELIQKLCKKHGLTEGNSAQKNKPHGRRAYVLMLPGFGHYVDLSIMPVLKEDSKEQVV